MTERADGAREPTGVADHWDAVYASRSTGAIDDNDVVGQDALAHLGTLEGKRLLDVGCGTGDYSMYFARQGADVTAVDVSAVAITALNERCADDGVANVHPVVSGAFDIQTLGPFDAIFGSMILHHLEPFDEFVDVLADAMTEGGRAFFYENSAMSRTLVWCREHLVGRFGIPKNSDDDEFPLQPQEIDLLRRRFDVTVEYPTLYLARMAAGYLFRGHGERQLGWIDARMYRFDRLRRLSYRQYVILEKR